MAVKKISRWEVESASFTTKGDQRDSWKEHQKMTLAVAPIMQGRRVVRITGSGGTHDWFLDELIETLMEVQAESPALPRYQIKD